MKEYPKKIYEKIRAPAIKFCVERNISANKITVFNHLITIIFCCYFFSRGTYWGWLAGLFVCLINGFLDYLDGDIAKETKKSSILGVWLDSGFDVIMQNIVLGSIAIGCYKMQMPLVWIVLFFVSNAANNFVSFHYNNIFGFDSDKGNELFRDLMDEKPNVFNFITKCIIDPTSYYIALIYLTYRYWIALGAVLNIMPICFITISMIATVKWIFMYVLLAMYLSGNRNLHVLKTLSKLDEESDDFYRFRDSKDV